MDQIWDALTTIFFGAPYVTIEVMEHLKFDFL